LFESCLFIPEVISTVQLYMVILGSKVWCGGLLSTAFQNLHIYAVKYPRGLTNSVELSTIQEVTSYAATR
jgi:hypothetical protein